jgi:hypothetical protein
MVSNIGCRNEKLQYLVIGLDRLRNQELLRQEERSEFVKRKNGVGIMTENKKGKRVRGKEENQMNASIIDGCRKTAETPWPENSPMNRRNRRIRRRIVVIDKVT